MLDSSFIAKDFSIREAIMLSACGRSKEAAEAKEAEAMVNITFKH
jgi:hypothetical protein